MVVDRRLIGHGTAALFQILLNQPQAVSEERIDLAMGRNPRRNSPPLRMLLVRTRIATGTVCAQQTIDSDIALYHKLQQSHNLEVRASQRTSNATAVAFLLLLVSVLTTSHEAPHPHQEPQQLPNRLQFHRGRMLP